MLTHFVLVPSLQSLLVRLQSHPTVQQCTQGARTTNSWRTRSLKICSTLCGRHRSLTLSRGNSPFQPQLSLPHLHPFPADCSRSPRPNNWKKAWHRSQQLVRAWKSWRRRPLFPKRVIQKRILALQFWGLHISWLRISWLSCLPMTQRFDRKMLLECQGQVVFFYVLNGDWKSILAQLQLCQWPGFKHICSCDESKYAKYRVSSLNQLVLTSTWRTLDGPLCANVLDTCHMLYETAVTVDANWPRTWKHSWISWAPRRTHKDCSWNMLKW